jgi:hypothetical protein
MFLRTVALTRRKDRARLREAAPEPAPDLRDGYIVHANRLHSPHI